MDDGWRPQVNLFSRHLTYYVADAALAAQITRARTRFPKPVDFYRVLATFGPNVLVAEGDAWKAQRRVVAPAFSERNNRLVWKETERVVRELVRDVWGHGGDAEGGKVREGEEAEVAHVLDITVPVRL